MSWIKAEIIPPVKNQKYGTWQQSENYPVIVEDHEEAGWQVGYVLRYEYGGYQWKIVGWNGDYKVSHYHVLAVYP